MNGGVSSRIYEKIKSSITIETTSIQLLVEAYNCAFIDKKYDLDWEEEQFTAHLVSIMNKLDLTKKFQLHIGIEEKLLDEEQLPIGANNPKSLPRMDINVESWFFKEGKNLKYFFEAKNLCQNDWYKKSGAKVSENYYTKRYIDTGIENFRTGRYYNGALIGYILEGKVAPIVDKLNAELLKNTHTIHILKLESTSFQTNIKDLYKSTHLTPLGNNLDIKHLFLSFI